MAARNGSEAGMGERRNRLRSGSNFERDSQQHLSSFPERHTLPSFSLSAIFPTRLQSLLSCGIGIGENPPLRRDPSSSFSRALSLDVLSSHTSHPYLFLLSFFPSGLLFALLQSSLMFHLSAGGV